MGILKAGRPSDRVGKMMQEEAATTRLTFEIPTSLHKALKVRAVAEETSMRDIITHAIKQYLQQTAKP